MKYFLLLLVLLFTMQTTYAQSITLDNILHLNELSTIEVNTYLVAHGWKFNSKEKQDSTFIMTWNYITNEQNNILIERIIEVGQRPITRYCTHNQAAFLSIQKRIAALNMIQLGEDLNNDGIATGYRGQRYEAWLEVHPATTSTTSWYAIQVQQHGLVEGTSIDQEGNQERIWLRPSSDGKGGVLVGISGPIENDESKRYLFPMKNLPESSYSTSERLKADSVLRDFELRTRPNSQTQSLPKKRQK